jgi:hypothetical protein
MRFRVCKPSFPAHLGRAGRAPRKMQHNDHIQCLCPPIWEEPFGVLVGGTPCHYPLILFGAVCAAVPMFTAFAHGLVNPGTTSMGWAVIANNLQIW